MTLKDWNEKYTAHLSRNSIPKMTDRCYGISGYLDRLAGHYTAFFTSKASAIKAAQFLANATRESVDLIAIQDHGNLRHVIGEVSPDPFSKFQD